LADARTGAVRERAAIYEGDSARVWVALKAGAIASRQIRVGQTLDGMVEALAVLAPGKKVVTNGTPFSERAANGD
jgi:hypothetical protein